MKKPPYCARISLTPAGPSAGKPNVLKNSIGIANPAIPINKKIIAEPAVKKAGRNFIGFLSFLLL